MNEVKIGNVDRAKIATDARADLFVRIHCDGSTNPKQSGTSVLVPTKNKWTASFYDESRLVGEKVLEHLVKECGRSNNGVVERSNITGFNWSTVPMILVEVAFLSNPEEAPLLNTKEFGEKAATGIFAGVMSYLQIKENI